MHTTSAHAGRRVSRMPSSACFTMCCCVCCCAVCVTVLYRRWWTAASTSRSFAPGFAYALYLALTGSEVMRPVLPFSCNHRLGFGIVVPDWSRPCYLLDNALSLPFFARSLCRTRQRVNDNRQRGTDNPHHEERA